MITGNWEDADTGSPVTSAKVIFLLDGDLGLWTFEKYKDGLRIHANMTARGKRCRKSAIDAFKWIFDNTLSNTIYANIPKENKPACYMAVWSGMTFADETNGRRNYYVNR